MRIGIGIGIQYLKTKKKNNVPVYTFGVYIDCISEPLIVYSSSVLLNIGSYVYQNTGLTVPFFYSGFSESSFPGPVLPIGFASNSSGLITSNTADIGGCG
jgi:hypothetical protein